MTGPAGPPPAGGSDIGSRMRMPAGFHAWPRPIV
jgi:hypothetical protein